MQVLDNLAVFFRFSRPNLGKSTTKTGSNYEK